MNWNIKIFSFAASVALILLASGIAALGQGTADEDPIKIFNDAQTAHETGEFETALKLYEKALEIIPEFPEAEYQRGNAFISLRRPEEAEKAFRRAIELRPNWTLPMTNLGVLLVKNNKFEEADELLTKTIQLSGLNFLAFIALTDLRIKTNASPDVLKELLTKIQYLTTKANPSAGLWTSRAALERILGDKKGAVASLERAIRIDPQDLSALAEHAELSLDEGDYKSAMIDAERLKQINPDSSSVDFLLARIYASMGDFDKSLRILDSIKDSSNEIKSFRDKVISNSTASIEDLEAKLGIDKNDSAALGRLCSLLRIDNPDKALEYCRRASELEPRNLEHAIGFGAALVRAKRYLEAVALFKRLLEFSPDNYTVHTNLATALFQLERFEEAKTEFNWIIKKQPDLPIAYYFLAISHDRLGEYLDAAANYQQFLRIADKEKNELEIDKVNLRLPGLQDMIARGKGKRKKND